jgi:hypothetical protein
VGGRDDDDATPVRRVTGSLDVSGLLKPVDHPRHRAAGEARAHAYLAGGRRFAGGYEL